MGVTPGEVRSVQACYPRIYLACHVHHVRRDSTAANLTSDESSLLSHLDERVPARATELARHMGVSRSTMSAAIKRLATLGYIARTAEAEDRRAAELRLTPAGARAMQTGSVLDTQRVKKLLGRLSARERQTALEGLRLLARAAAEVDR